MLRSESSRSHLIVSIFCEIASWAAVGGVLLALFAL
jgi:hypothetical protein